MPEWQQHRGTRRPTTPVRSTQQQQHPGAGRERMAPGWMCFMYRVPAGPTGVPHSDAHAHATPQSAAGGALLLVVHKLALQHRGVLFAGLQACPRAVLATCDASLVCMSKHACKHMLVLAPSILSLGFLIADGSRSQLTCGAAATPAAPTSASNGSHCRWSIRPVDLSTLATEIAAHAHSAPANAFVGMTCAYHSCPSTARFDAMPMSCTRTAVASWRDAR